MLKIIDSDVALLLIGELFEPSMLEGLLGGEPPLGLADEFLDEVDGFFGNVVPVLVEDELAFLDVPDDLLVVIAIEWWIAAEHDV